ncbi:MAG: hypothetical protein IT259_03210 [Saprospiraceae bacterium]|nr:hypothetical protein [Saprospiraceae bacterium]
MRIFILLLVLLPLLLSAQQPTRWYVSAEAAGQNTGQNWTDAFTNLHDALALAVAGDEIWVAEGVYRPSETGDRTARFQLSPGVALLGGFAGTELDESEREWTEHPTVLSGDLGVPDDSLDNSYTILYMAYPDTSTVLDGFILRDGQANQGGISNGQAGVSGAALYIMGQDGEAYPTIRNCSFEHNTALRSGGAVYVNGSGTGSVAPSFDNCHFVRNRSALNNGGAVARDGGSWLERPRDFYRCAFVHNEANKYGGALYWLDSERADTLHISGCFFEGGRTYDSNNIGGSCLWTGRPRIANTCVVVENTEVTGFNEGGNYLFSFDAESNIGTMVVYFQKMNIHDNKNASILLESVEKSAEFYFSNSLFYENKYANVSLGSNTGGKINLVKDTIFNNNYIFIIAGNSTNYDQVNIKYDYLFVYKNEYYSQTNIVGTDLSYFYDFSNNTFYDNNELDIYCDSIINCSFINNKQVAITGSYKYFMSNTIVVGNNSFEGNPDFVYFDNDNEPLYDVLLSYNLTDVEEVANAYTLGPGMIFGADPMFVDTAAHDFRLLPCSPAINAGDNNLVEQQGLLYDLAGHPRIQNGTVDIGALESPPLSLSAQPLVRAACGSPPSGSVRWLVADACEPLGFVWSEGANSGADTIGLAPGNYSFTLTDARGRTATESVAIPPGSDPQLSVWGDTLVCAGAADGYLFGAVTGAVQPYDLVWSTGDDTPELSDLPAGLYTLLVVDALGCRDSIVQLVGEPPMPLLDAQIQPASGPTVSNGSIQVDVQVGLGPFQFLWNTGDTSAQVDEILPGEYLLTLTDGAGCTYDSTFIVEFVSGTEVLEGHEIPALWPNPSSGQVHLYFGAADQWRLYDALGREVSALQGESGLGFRTVLPILPEGLYYYRFMAGERVVGRGRLVLSR